MVDLGSIEVLREHNACTKLSEASSHMDTWRNVRDTYGQEIHGANKLLKSIFLNIIPCELKQEILREKSLVYAGHLELTEWCRARATVLQQETLAAVTKKHLEQMSSKRSIHVIVKQKKIEEEIEEERQLYWTPASCRRRKRNHHRGRKHSLLRPHHLQLSEV